jgi:NDP-sugar pyrophosphorylase family protein
VSASAWKGGVIAAGRGERLRSSDAPLKPLVRVRGETLVRRVLMSIGEVAPREVAVIINEDSTAVRDHVDSRDWSFALRWIVETTPSSMHSFIRIVEALAGDGDAGPFLISTVDTVAPPGAYRRFAEASRALAADVVLAVTPTWDDEKPLLVRAGADRRVQAIGDAIDMQAGTENLFATAGYYCVRSTVLQEAASARAAGVGALRAFFGRLVARGYDVAAVPVPASIDVDRPADLAAAEAFLRQAGA